MFWSRLIQFVKIYQRDVVFIAILALVFVSGYNIGQIKKSDGERSEIKVITPAMNEQVRGVEDSAANPTPALTPVNFSNIEVIASKKSSSKAYHFPWCPSVGKIKEENKLVFANEAEAQAAGFRLAGNCTK